MDSSGSSNFTLLNGVSSDHSQKWVITKWIRQILQPKYKVPPAQKVLKQGLRDMYHNRTFYEKTSPQAELDRVNTTIARYAEIPDCYK